MLLEQKPTKDNRAQEIITLLQNELQKSTQIVEHVRSLVKKRPKEKKICDLGVVVSNALGQGLYAQAVENNVPKENSLLSEMLLNWNLSFSIL